MLNKGDFQRDLYLAQGKRHSDGAYRGKLCIPWCVFFKPHIGHMTGHVRRSFYMVRVRSSSTFLIFAIHIAFLS